MACIRARNFNFDFRLRTVDQTGLRWFFASNSRQVETALLPSRLNRQTVGLPHEGFRRGDRCSELASTAWS